METIALHQPDPGTALNAFERLGRDVWARPNVGAGGTDVFHLTTRKQLHAALLHYAASDQDWLLSRDARNLTSDGFHLSGHPASGSTRTLLVQPSRFRQRHPGCPMRSGSAWWRPPMVVIDSCWGGH